MWSDALMIAITIIHLWCAIFPSLKFTFFPYAEREFFTDLLSEDSNAAWLFSEYLALQIQDVSMDDTMSHISADKM